MRTPHKGTLWGELSRYSGKGMGGAGEMREQETSYRRFDKTRETRKRRAADLFNERHALSALFCSGFLVPCRHLGSNRYALKL